MTDCLKQVLKTDGPKGLFRGCMVLTVRDSFSFGFYFLSFEFMRRTAKANHYKNDLLIDFVCGGFAGYYN
jgi:hypothetical protein